MKYIRTVSHQGELKEVMCIDVHYLQHDWVHVQNNEVYLLD